jgi:type II secretory pathway pseudopilin PulG
LIELVGVLTLIGIVSAVVMVSFRGPVNTARFNRFCEELRNIDQGTRRSSIAAGRSVEIVYDIPNARIRIGRWQRDRYFEQNRIVPSGINIAAIQVVDRAIEKTGLRVPISATGESVTYGIGVEMGNVKRWLVFVGATGQCLEYDNETEFLQLFEGLAETRIDLN